MRVADHMTADPVTVTEADLLSDAARRMREGGFRRLPVVRGGALCGIVTERDLREHVGFLESTRVSGAMTEGALTTAPSETVEAVVRLLLERKIGGLPVVEGGKLVGIITTSDVLRAWLEASDGNRERPDRPRARG